jgi:hypothetical protein
LTRAPSGADRKEFSGIACLIFGRGLDRLSAKPIWRGRAGVARVLPSDGSEESELDLCPLWRPEPARLR